MRHESVDKYLAGIGDIDAVERLAQGADEYDAPEPLHQPLGLIVFAEPVGERPVRGGMVARERLEGTCERQLLAPGEEPQSREGSGQMQRCRKRTGGKPALLAFRSDECQGRLGPQQISQSQTVAEIVQIRAAPHGDVLTVVDQLPRRLVDERAGPAPQPGP